jgi:hypothetical protein
MQAFDLFLTNNFWSVGFLFCRSDYKVNAFVCQKSLEDAGVELVVDDFDGYLFHYPKYQLFSSTGVFDKDLSRITLMQSQSLGKDHLKTPLSSADIYFNSQQAIQNLRGGGGSQATQTAGINFWQHPSIRTKVSSYLQTLDRLDKEKLFHQSKRNLTLLQDRKEELLDAMKIYYDRSEREFSSSQPAKNNKVPITTPKRPDNTSSIGTKPMSGGKFEESNFSHFIQNPLCEQVSLITKFILS